MNSRREIGGSRSCVNIPQDYKIGVGTEPNGGYQYYAPHIPGTTSHYVLAGLAVPVWHWRDCDREIGMIKQQFGLEDAEIHAAWILRKYSSQYKIDDFDNLNYDQRRYEVGKLRKSRLLALQKSGKP